MTTSGDGPSLTGYSTTGQALTHSVKLIASEQYALTTDYTNKKLTCWDVSDRANPTVASTLSLTGNPLYVWPVPGGTYAYVTTFDAVNTDLYIVNISNPNSISLTNTLTNANLEGGQDILFLGHYAILAARDAGVINVLDITDPTSPSISSSRAAAGVTHLDVSADENYLFAALSAGSTINSYDISSLPTIPVASDTLGTNLSGPHEIVRKGNYLFIANLYFTSPNEGSVVVFDISDPTNMAYETQIYMDGTDPANDIFLNFAHGLWLDGNYVYVAAGYPAFGGGDLSPWQSAITKIDATDQTNPSVIWSRQCLPYTRGAHQITRSSDGYLFIASQGLPGLAIYQDTD